METNGYVLGLVGSPNRKGRTFEVVSAALEGAASRGAKVELVQMADHVVAPCQDCEPWKCVTERKCQFPDPSFEYLTDKLFHCGALVLGTPIYWWDTSAMVKYLILKMFRVHAGSGPLAGLPAVGVGVAGGSGNGLVAGLRPIYHFFQMMQMRALDPLPVTRFDWKSAIARAPEQGAELASMLGERRPFASLEERLLWYDNLPYLGMSRVAERRFLAALTTEALPDDAILGLNRLLARAEHEAALGHSLDSLKTTTAVYEATMKAFESAQA